MSNNSESDKEYQTRSNRYALEYPQELVGGTPVTCINRPAGVTLLTLFFIFGSCMAFLTGVMLVFPGSLLEPLWRLNPHAHTTFAALGFWAVFLMGAVTAACAIAALGLWNCARWGYLMALTLLSINVFGDTLNAWITGDWRTLIGLPIGGAMILYLVKKKNTFAA